MTLIDFNVAKRTEDDGDNRLLMMTNTGTAKYKAPEMLGGSFTHYDEKVDLWSSGVVLYFILIGEHAFNFECEKEIEDAISKGEYCKPIKFNTISEDAQDLI